MNIGKLVDFDELDAETQQLIREGARARDFSYSPYSKFSVGAALRCQDGSVKNGCNVENASYPVSICAERCALTKAVSEGQRSYQAISVVADKNDGRLTTPCGMCRQMLSEFGDFSVYIASPELKEVLVTTTDNLLPFAFKASEDNLLSKFKFL